MDRVARVWCHAPVMRTVREQNAATHRRCIDVIGSSLIGHQVLADTARVAPTETTVPEQLLESELFGYERGAFTGAQQSKAGYIEMAARGVLFLDEVSEMSLAAQAKLLRFLQEREYQRLGGSGTRKADVRVIAASNRDLDDMVRRGTFRQDLLYRLQVFDIVLPPLRARGSDVHVLAEHFLVELATAMGRRVPRLLDDARDALSRHE